MSGKGQREMRVVNAGLSSYGCWGKGDQGVFEGVTVPEGDYGPDSASFKRALSQSDFNPVATRNRAAPGIQ